MLAIRISFPQRHSGNSVQPGINSRSNPDMEPRYESESRFRCYAQCGDPPLGSGVGSLSTWGKCRKGPEHEAKAISERLKAALAAPTRVVLSSVAVTCFLTRREKARIAT